ncbi:MAG: winged helix-turn-helix domain-containing protein [Candidatus Tyrphobacter sp.]
MVREPLAMVVYEFGPFRLDAQRLLLYRDGAPIALGPKVVETLLALVERAGEIVSKQGLLGRVWPEGYVEEANLTQNVYVLRKLFRASRCAGAIETIARRGYRFTFAVRRLDAIPTPEHVPRRASRMALAAMAALLVFAIGAWAHGLSREPATPPMSAPAQLFTMGNFFLTLRTRSGVEHSVALFSRAIAQDPRDAQAFGARASAYAVMADYGYGASPSRDDRARARADASRALALDPRCGQAYAALGLLALDSGSGRGAVGDLQRAVALTPSDAAAHVWYGIALVARGRITEGEVELRTAQRINPLSIAATSWLAWVAYLEHRYDEAIAEAHEGLAVAPTRYELWITLGLAQEARGRQRPAIVAFTHYAQACRACRAEGAALLAYAYERLHLAAAARQELAIAATGPVRPEDLALALAVEGEHGMAIRRLARKMSNEDRIFALDDPRFGALSSTDRRLIEQQG